MTDLKEDMSVGEHLEELRRRLLIVIILLVIGSIAAFVFSDVLIRFLLAPVEETGVGLASFKPQEKFLAYLKASFLTALIAVVPVILWQLAAFIMPALRKREKRIFALILVLMVLFFGGGALFSWLFLAPFVFEFFAEFGGNDSIAPLWSIGAYIELVFTLVILIGLVFQTPWVLLILIRSGILRVSTLMASRKYVIVGIFVSAALLTPPDVYTQLIVAGLLWVFFELTLLIGRWITPESSEEPQLF